MPTSVWPRRWQSTCAALALLCLAPAGHVLAASLQVAPTSLQLTPRQNAEALWISNSGTRPVTVQVRLFEWTQGSGQDDLRPTQALLASPPMHTLPAGQQQLIRVVRADPARAPLQQQAYRVIVDELPEPGVQQSGMQFVLRYSIPVFVQPTGEAPLQHALHARTVAAADGAMTLEVHNSGSSYAQLADVALGTPERPQIVHPGLLGYVLPGQTMRWPLDVSATALAGGTLSAKINGESAQTPLPTTAPAR